MKLKVVMTVTLLLLGAFVLYENMEALGNEAPEIEMESLTYVLNQYENITFHLNIEDPDGDNFTVYSNMEDLDFFGQSVRDQLPYFTPVKGVNWDFYLENLTFWWKIDQQEIWKTNVSMLDRVSVNLTFYAIDEHDEWAIESRIFMLKNKNDPPEQPVEIFCNPDGKVRVGQNVQFWVDTVSDPDDDDISYKWDFGDGATAEEQVVNHIFSKKGWRTIQFWAEDGQYQTEKISYRMEIVDGLYVSIPDNTSTEWDKRKTLTILPEIFNPDDRNITILWNFEDHDSFDTTIQDQLPYHEMIKGKLWDINRETGEMWWYFNDYGIWYTGDGGKYDHVNVTLSVLVFDDLGNEWMDSIRLTIFKGPLGSPPEAPEKIHHDPEIIYEKTKVKFWVDEPYDPDGDPLWYDWDFGHNGLNMDQKGKRVVTYFFEYPGNYTIGVDASDGFYSSERVILNITVLEMATNEPPVLNISSPMDYSTHMANTTIKFSSEGSYDPDGDELRFFWFLNNTEYLGQGPVIYRQLPMGYHRIVLWGTDGFANYSVETYHVLVTDDHTRIDTDLDGISDVNDTDDDNDGIPDIMEDLNNNGIVDIGETDPKDPDTDGDGVEDKKDLYPLDPTKYKDEDDTGPGGDDTGPVAKNDTDNDGVEDELDAFPTDPAASIDDDGDGFPDEWNPGMSAKDSTTGLKLDKQPGKYNDKYPVDEDENYLLLFILVAVAVVIVIILAGILSSVIITKRKDESSFSGDLREYKREIVSGNEERYSDEGRLKKLKRSKKKGMISKDLYKDIEDEIETYEFDEEEDQEEYVRSGWIE